MYWTSSSFKDQPLSLSVLGWTKHIKLFCPVLSNSLSLSTSNHFFSVRKHWHVKKIIRGWWLGLHILLKLSQKFNFQMKPFIYLLKNLTEWKLNSAVTVSLLWRSCQKLPLNGRKIHESTLINMMTLMPFYGHTGSLYGTPVKNKEKAQRISDQNTGFQMPRFSF